MGPEQVAPDVRVGDVVDDTADKSRSTMDSAPYMQPVPVSEGQPGKV